jgi:uncharacterized protein
VPAAVLGEISYLISARLSSAVLEAFISDLEPGNLTLDCGEQDFPRVRALVRRYASLPLDLVDAAVIACAERNGRQVMTLNPRDFGVVAREGTISILPD